MSMGVGIINQTTRDLANGYSTMRGILTSLCCSCLYLSWVNSDLRELRRVWFIAAVVCYCEVASLFGAPGYEVRMCWGHSLLGKWYWMQ
jgi:hypothetical protein